MNSLKTFHIWSFITLLNTCTDNDLLISQNAYVYAERQLMTKLYTINATNNV